MSDDFHIFRMEPFSGGAQRFLDSNTKASGIADGVAMLSSAFADSLFRRQVRDKIEAKDFQKAISNALQHAPRSGGVLVIVSYHASTSLGGTHYRDISVSIGAVDKDPIVSIERSRLNRQIYASPPNKLYKRMNEYLWYTFGSVKNIYYTSKNDKCYKTYDTHEIMSWGKPKR